MIKGNTASTIAYVEQDFDMPPAIMISSGAHTTKAFQSNPHHYNYPWGKSELITYRNSKGRQLNAALYYPAGYNPEFKYPMVVSIYDRRANLVHNYASPSMENSDGFNAANLTSSGYFVLMPDIAYEIGSPGYSATDCVVSLVKEVLAKGQVDPARIGLIGHSYGGYETDFIITQTDIFAAAVAGAAITDLQSSYLYASWNYKKPNFWHYEYNQLRMGGSIFNNYLGFISNSPTYHAEKVKTPLLSWTGQNDMQVHYYQSIEFYLALRRLGKEHIMLIYPGQGHALADHTAQVDLTEKIEAWFGYHLKGDEKPQWCKADLPR
jgi:dipeptidyl aminopeptidase/acylaminoacyl peptidase